MLLWLLISFLMFVLLLLPMISFSPPTFWWIPNRTWTPPYLNPSAGFKTVSCYLSWSPDLHHFLSPLPNRLLSFFFFFSPPTFFSPLPALWKANEESWAEGSFCVLVKKNNLCQRKVLQQLCCRTCSLNGWRNRLHSANLYCQPRTSNMGLCWEVSRCQNYNKPTFTCVCGFGRTCQGVATGINNKQQIIWFSILWPKHGCQNFCTHFFIFILFYLGSEIKSERHTDWISDVFFFVLSSNSMMKDD